MGSRSLIHWSFLITLLLLMGCGEDKSRKIDPIPQTPPPKSVIQIIETPVVNRDSALAFVQKQVDFGPRVPNTDAHKKCAVWLEATLKRYGLKTNVQEAKVKAFNGKELEIYNIMGQFNPEAKERILLCAHWDSRPFADRDAERLTEPIDGANDGASGVGVLLEIARAIDADSMSPTIGFDVLFLDAEDYGKPQTTMYGTNSSQTWCLGSQYWAAHIPIENYQPKFGILLDMVGAPNAIFPQEYQSLQFAPDIVDKVWNIAHSMGYKDYFSTVRGNPITDDHVYLNKIAGIPTIDIIHYEMFRNDFGTFHHTHRDNMDGIDKATLGVVGDVVMQVLFQE